MREELTATGEFVVAAEAADEDGRDRPRPPRAARPRADRHRLSAPGGHRRSPRSCAGSCPPRGSCSARSPTTRTPPSRRSAPAPSGYVRKDLDVGPLTPRAARRARRRGGDLAAARHAPDRGALPPVGARTAPATRRRRADRARVAGARPADRRRRAPPTSPTRSASPSRPCAATSSTCCASSACAPAARPSRSRGACARGAAEQQHGGISMSQPNPQPFPRIWGRRSLTCSVIPHQRVPPERREI